MALALNCGIPSTPQGRELVQHGSALFPIACYEERLTCYSVPWHWHEDFEYILAYEGTVTVGVDKKRICLAEGEGVFINSGVLHAVEFAAEGPSALRSGVFHPRLVGGMDTIYWQKLIRPLLQPGVPSYFLLSKGEPWQAEGLARLRALGEAVFDGLLERRHVGLAAQRRRRRRIGDRAPARLHGRRKCHALYVFFRKRPHPSASGNDGISPVKSFFRFFEKIPDGKGMDGFTTIIAEKWE